MHEGLRATFSLCLALSASFLLAGCGVQAAAASSCGGRQVSAYDFQSDFGCPSGGTSCYDDTRSAGVHAPALPVEPSYGSTALPGKTAAELSGPAAPELLASSASGSGSNDLLADPFEDVNRTLGQTGATPAASSLSGGARTFRVIATAQGDIGKQTALGLTMQKWSEGAALPSRRALKRPIVVQYLENSQVASCKVLDVGPWNTNDPYWEKAGGRPQAESGRDRRGRRTNRAGIDLFNATWYKLLELKSYDRRLLESTTGEVEWQFQG